MEIRFINHQRTSALCLMQGPGRPKLSVVDFSPRLFQGTKATQHYKFIYEKPSDRLLLGPEDLPHRLIAFEAFRQNFNKSELVGAYLVGQEKDGTVRFELYGKSGYFGQPDRAALRLVAEHIASRLESASITDKDNFAIEGRLPND